jgi:hypothetical protein
MESSGIYETMRAHRADLLPKKNVVGIGVGLKERNGVLTNTRCIVVFVKKKQPKELLARWDLVPPSVMGVPTDVKEGEFIPMLLRTERWRPAPGGVSVGHYGITAGTLGCWVKDRRSRNWMILSNNHVMAKSNISMPGDAVLQPGPYDGGSPAYDRIARLARFVPLTKGTNEVDCAVADVLKPEQVDNSVFQVGTLVRGTGVAQLGDILVKSGRTTGLTTGIVTCLALDIYVYFGGSLGTILFTDQIEISGFYIVGGGDSGSIWCKGEKAVGLLFAGTIDGKRSIANHIETVLSQLDVVIGEAETYVDNILEIQYGEVAAERGRRLPVQAAGYWRLGI